MITRRRILAATSTLGWRQLVIAVTLFGGRRCRGLGDLSDLRSRRQ
jgi:hypothetical protein